MKQPALYRAFRVIAAFLLLGWLAQPAFAQRGGHGGGGFHGGGGGGFHGGGGYHGGYYGGGYHGWSGGYGWRGGYYGWRGGYWGYPRYGHGWGWGFGFGWPYWGWGYPYAYGYSPWYGASPYFYSYPNYCPPGYPCSDNGNDDPPPADPPGPQPNANGPAKPWRSPVPGAAAPDPNHVNSYVESPDVSAAPILSVDRITAEPSSYGVAHSTAKPSSPPRPEVQYAMRELREMPPFVRQREIETGRYSHFSAQEKELLRSVN